MLSDERRVVVEDKQPSQSPLASAPSLHTIALSPVELRPVSPRVRSTRLTRIEEALPDRPPSP